MAGRAVTLVALLGMALVLAVLARWGRAHADELVPQGLPEEDRNKRAAVVRRGALVCYGGSIVMVASGLLAVL